MVSRRQVLGGMAASVGALFVAAPNPKPHKPNPHKPTTTTVAATTTTAAATTTTAAPTTTTVGETTTTAPAGSGDLFLDVYGAAA
jgi:hypothetical protein